MRRELAIGAAAGAIGTVTLNIATYLDMLAGARGASGVPAQVAGRLAEQAGIDSVAESNESDEAETRRSATGALLGFATGLGVGVAYGAVRAAGLRVPTVVAGPLLGLAAMATSDVPATALDVTDPRDWPASSWVSDIVPHLAYGIATAVAYGAIDGT